MPVSIIDSYALMALPGICRDETALNQVLRALTAAVRAGSLTFPDAVVSECHTYAPDEFCTTWVDAVSAERGDVRVPYQCLRTALKRCRGVVDEDGGDPQAQPDVAAMAVFLEDVGVTLVSDDLITAMDRTPLAVAAASLGFPHVTMREYVESLGLAALLV